MDHDYSMPSTSRSRSESSLDSTKTSLHGNKLAQEFIRNTYKYFAEVHPDLSPLQETAKALQISQPSVKKYRNGPTEKSLIVSRNKIKNVTNVREGVRAEIRNEIYSMYSAKKQVTLRTLYARLMEREVFNGSLMSLLRILKTIGFSYKPDDNRRALMEQPHVSMLRRKFLKKYMDNEALELAKKPYVFLDETWVFSNGSVRKSWQDDDIRSVKKTSGEGNRFIVLHAGTSSGFVENASLIFKSKQNSGDYHGDMNAENFEKWLKNSLLPSLEEPSIILLDNASYHSRQSEKWPTKSWRKGDLQDWLQSKDIAFTPWDTVNRLWEVIAQVPKPDKSYVVDEFIRDAGHEVIRLPPYHCQFNAIELVWSQAKRFYDARINSVKDVLECWRMALKDVSSEQWSNYVHHTDKTIKQAWEKEKDIIVDQEPIIIHVSDGDDSSSDEG